MKPAFLLTLAAAKQDLSLLSGRRGARKVMVTELYPEHETETDEVVWQPPLATGKCAVQVRPDMEIAHFTQHATQDRHFHKLGTEFYAVLEGNMTLDVAGQTYWLAAGDMMVVHPGTLHQVKPEGTEFLCRVISVNCGGVADKYVKDSR